jgi:PPOX class probable F420-dependent enzyme
MDPQRKTMTLSPDTIAKLETSQNLWFGSVRADGRPHLAPVWYVWHDGKIYISTDPQSVKVGNLRSNPQVVVALEDGNHPVICEGTAAILSTPYPKALLAVFLRKYEWDVPADKQYHMVVEVTPRKWLIW